ncbi:hCG1769714 [Homo sapiens]|uniref:SMAD5 antisense gene protein 1 n=1 Tax=Homo sapiens TaxID=9606 RepID=SMA5O_HUMAN|nr:RecName: Full=SMAD5 antisense gene protein 1; AltName: Full=10.3 kDa proline-rich protein DAMS; AltName: Full=SMAD5 antisense RNA 1; AltName: Full=SMAD5 opposite strand protein [Homo sapiens]AAD20804.1 unknown [Homo sapiens]EAW62197.1 hCG1769714 [Homo sapiens]
MHKQPKLLPPPATPPPPPQSSSWSGNIVFTIKINIWLRVFSHSSPTGLPKPHSPMPSPPEPEHSVGKPANVQIPQVSSPEFCNQKSVLATEHAQT